MTFFRSSLYYYLKSYRIWNASTYKTEVDLFWIWENLKNCVIWVFCMSLCGLQSDLSLEVHESNLSPRGYLSLNARPQRSILYRDLGLHRSISKKLSTIL